MQAEKNEQYGQKSKMKAFFCCFNFDMGNVGIKLPPTIFCLQE